VSADRLQQFAELYDDHVWDVYGYLGYRVRGREEAEELTQATFERALKAWDRYDPARASARTWLLAIAHNLLVDHYRRGRSIRQEPLAEGEDADVQLGGSGRQQAELDAALGIEPEIELALGQLGDRERQLIGLRYGADLTGAEIAELTGLTLANVQQILSRAVRRLRTLLVDSEVAETRR
jgi:RNA polymerase sigma-70 factor (ECF subfamily)